MAWWPKRSRWEEKSVPIFGFTASPRQIVIFVLSAAVGGGLAAALGRAGMLAQFAAFMFVILLGVTYASLPVRSVPMELILWYALTHRGPRPAQPPPTAPGAAPGPARAEPEPPTDLYADSTVPLVIEGEVRSEGPVRVRLLVDGQEAAAATVGPSNPRYRLVFTPGDWPMGEHELVVMVGDEAVRTMRVTVRPRAAAGATLLEAAGQRGS
ncbi:MAG: hypothetical protein RXR82_07505 [Nitrososphaeria archaeon]